MVADELAGLHGNITTDCPKFAKKPCYKPCDHLNEIIQKFYNVENYGGSPRHYSLAKAFLEVQEEFIHELCNFELDVCTRGALIGFPCVQCHQVISPKFDLCANEEVVCGSTTYFYRDPCKSLCADLCEADCKISEFDFTSSQEGNDLYTKIVDAISGLLVNESNFNTVNNFVKQIWGDLAETVYLKNYFYVWPGRNPSNLEVSIQSIIESAIPLPICTKLKLVSKN